MQKDELELAKLIADLGAASEVELQAQTLKPLKELREELGRMEKNGIVRRRIGMFKSGYGDALELTPDGYKSVSK